MTKLFILCLVAMPALALAKNPLNRYQATCLVADTRSPEKALGHATIDLKSDETAEIFRNDEFSYSATLHGKYRVSLDLKRSGVAYSSVGVWLGSEFPRQIDLVGNAGFPITMTCVTQ
jgi:hypothetical protein